MSLQGAEPEYVTNMFPDLEDPVSGYSEIANFYAGSNVLITGASGFLGRLLVDKILRSCPNVGRIYMFIRAKKGKTSEERFAEYFEDVVFERLKRERPGYRSKVMLVEGDIAKIGLGISPENRQLLMDTNIVIHCAATVRFDAQLRVAVKINVLGTKELLMLAKEMTNLKAFVHVSTAYSQCVLREIDEKLYPAAMTAEQLISLVDMMDDEKLDKITPVLIGEWPNTYTFTKAVAEGAVQHYCNGIPACIVRPSIIIPTSKEPIAGWINNFYGPTGITAAAGLGLIRTIHSNGNMVADIIPADYVVNLIIVAAWDIAKAKSINPNRVDFVPELDDEGSGEPPVYNGVSSCQKPITWGHYMKQNELHGLKIQSVHVLWYYYLALNSSLWVHKIFNFFLHLVPAAIVDSLAYVTGRKPALLDAYKRISSLTEATTFFGLQQWRFHNRRVLSLSDKLNVTDRSIFDFNLDSLNWDDYFYNHIRGIRVYIVKDPLDTVPQGNAKYAKLKIAHYTLVTVLAGVMLWIFSKILGALGFY